MKVLLFSKYSRIGASTRLRALQYIPYLQSDNFEITTSNLFDDNYLRSFYATGRRSLIATGMCYIQRIFVLFSVFRYDVIWIEKELFPYLPAFAERLLKLLCKPYIVDYDDAIFHNYDLSASVLVRKILGNKIDTVMKCSSCVVAGNKYIADKAKTAGASYIEVIPTVVDHVRYIPRVKSTNESMVIGWIGSPSTQKYVLELRDILRNVCQKYEAKLYLIGANPQIALEFQGIDVSVIAWSEEQEADLIQKMDIGIMPLPDGPWEKGKCGYKLIQYMACAVPVIASPVGVNVDIVSHSQCGLLASNTSEWEMALSRLLSNPSERHLFGSAGRYAVENIYSLKVQAPILSRVITKSANRDGV